MKNFPILGLLLAGVAVWYFFFRKTATGNIFVTTGGVNLNDTRSAAKQFLDDQAVSVNVVETMPEGPQTTASTLGWTL